MSRRFLGAIAVATASAVGLVLLLNSLVRTAETGVRRPDDAVAFGVMVIGVVMLGWYLATAVAALACLATRAAGRAWIAGERRLSGWGAPLARRLLITGGSAAVVAVATLSPAAAVPAPTGPVIAATSDVVTLADDLGWGADTGDEPDQAPTDEPADEATSDDAETPNEDPSTTPAEPTPSSTSTTEPTSSTSSDESYTVLAGDSLWAITADHLPEGSSDASIAAAWPDWYEHNLDVIGDDPDVIHPGQVLTAPDHDSQEEA